MNANELKLNEGSYILMIDNDRYNDAEFDSEQDAINAMNDSDESGMWVGYVEKINDQLEIMFCCGEQA